MNLVLFRLVWAVLPCQLSVPVDVHFSSLGFGLGSLPFYAHGRLMRGLRQGWVP